jgi:hypothetical protein
MFGKPCFTKLQIAIVWIGCYIEALFDPKTGFFDSKTQTVHSFSKFWLISKLFSEHFCKNFASLKIPFFSEKFPKLAKTKSSENSV